VTTYENDLSAEEETEKQGTWLPGKNEEKERPQRAQEKTREGQKETYCLISRLNTGRKGVAGTNDKIKKYAV